MFADHPLLLSSYHFSCLSTQLPSCTAIVWGGGECVCSRQMLSILRWVSPVQGGLSGPPAALFYCSQIRIASRWASPVPVLLFACGLPRIAFGLLARFSTCLSSHPRVHARIQPVPCLSSRMANGAAFVACLLACLLCYSRFFSSSSSPSTSPSSLLLRYLLERRVVILRCASQIVALGPKRVHGIGIACLG